MSPKRFVLLALIQLGATLLSGNAGARPMADESALGLNETELHGAFPDLRPPRRPLVGPNGLRAQWQLPDEPWFGSPFDAVFYLRDNRVYRIERRWRSVEALCQQQSAYADLVTGLSSKYGPALASNDSGRNQSQRSAAWEAERFLVLAYFSESAGQCSVRVVYEVSDVKDASEL